MLDLTPYRGKRALVCGIPRDGEKTQHLWLEATDKALRTLGTKSAVSYSIGRRRADPTDLFAAYDVVLLTSGAHYAKDAKRYAKAAGVPVLRVRRDGSVEVDEP